MEWNGAKIAFCGFFLSHFRHVFLGNYELRSTSMIVFFCTVWNSLSSFLLFEKLA